MAVDFDELKKVFGGDKAKAAAFLTAFKAKFDSDPTSLTRKTYQEFVAESLASSGDASALASRAKLNVWGESAFAKGASDWPKWEAGTWGDFSKKVADTMLVWGEKAQDVGQGAMDAFNSGALMNAGMGILLGLLAVFPMRWFVMGAFTSATDIIPIPDFITTAFSLLVAVPAAIMIGAAFGKPAADGLRSTFEWAKEKGKGLFSTASVAEPEKAAAIVPESTGFKKVASVSAGTLDCAKEVAAKLPKAEHADMIALTCGIPRGDAATLSRLL